MIRIWTDAFDSASFDGSWRVKAQGTPRRGIAVTSDYDSYGSGYGKHRMHYGAFNIDDTLYLTGSSLGNTDSLRSPFTSFPGNTKFVVPPNYLYADVSRLLTDKERDLTLFDFVSGYIGACSGKLCMLDNEYNEPEYVEDESGAEIVAYDPGSGTKSSTGTWSVKKYTVKETGNFDVDSDNEPRLDGLIRTYVKKVAGEDAEALGKPKTSEITQLRGVFKEDSDKHDITLASYIKYGAEDAWWTAMPKLDEPCSDDFFCTFSDLKPGLYTVSDYANHYHNKDTRDKKDKDGNTVVDSRGYPVQETYDPYEDDNRKRADISNWSFLYRADIKYKIVRTSKLEYDESENDNDDSENRSDVEDSSNTNQSGKVDQNSQDVQNNNSNKTDKVDEESLVRKTKRTYEDKVVGETSFIRMLADNKIYRGTSHARYGGDVIIPVKGCSGFVYVIDGIRIGNFSQGTTIDGLVAVPHKGKINKTSGFFLRPRVTIRLAGVIRREDANSLGLDGSWHFLAMVPSIKNPAGVSFGWTYSIVHPEYIASETGEILGCPTEILHCSGPIDIETETVSDRIYFEEDVRFERKKGGVFVSTKNKLHRIFGNPVYAPYKAIDQSVHGTWGEYTKGAALAASKCLSGVVACGGIKIVKLDENGDEISEDTKYINVYTIDSTVKIPFGQGSTHNVTVPDIPYVKYGYMYLDNKYVDTYKLDNAGVVSAGLFNLLLLQPTLGMLKKSAKTFCEKFSVIANMPDRLFRLYRWALMVEAVAKGSFVFTDVANTSFKKGSNPIEYTVTCADRQAAFYSRTFSGNTIEEISRKVLTAANMLYAKEDMPVRRRKRELLVYRLAGEGNENTNHIAGYVRGSDPYWEDIGETRVQCFVRYPLSVSSSTYVTAVSEINQVEFTSAHVIKKLDARISALEKIANFDEKHAYLHSLKGCSLADVKRASQFIDVSIPTPEGGTESVKMRNSTDTVKCIGLGRYAGLVKAELNYVGRIPCCLATYKDYWNPYEGNYYSPPLELVINGHTYGARIWCSSVNIHENENYDPDWEYGDDEDDKDRSYDVWVTQATLHWVANFMSPWGGIETVKEASGIHCYIWIGVLRDGEGVSPYLLKRELDSSNGQDLVNKFIGWDNSIGQNRATYTYDRWGNYVGMNGDLLASPGFSDDKDVIVAGYWVYKLASGTKGSFVLTKDSDEISFKGTAGVGADSTAFAHPSNHNPPGDVYPGHIVLHEYSDDVRKDLLYYDSGSVLRPDSDSLDDNVVVYDGRKGSPVMYDVTDLLRLKDSPVLGIPDAFEVQSAQ